MHLFTKALPTVFVIAFVVTMSGCGGNRGYVSGTILFDDQTPLESGTVIMESVESPNIRLVGGIKVNGLYSVGLAEEGSYVPVGKYKVYVLNTEQIVEKNEKYVVGGKTVLSNRRQSISAVARPYTTPRRTPLECTVVKGRNVLNFQVEKP